MTSRAVELGHVVFDVLAVDHRLDLGRIGAFRLDDLDARQFLEGLEIGLALRVLQGPAIGAYAHRAAAFELVGNRIDLGQFDIGRQRRDRKGEGLRQRRRGRHGQAVARGVGDELAPRIVGLMRRLPRHGLKRLFDFLVHSILPFHSAEAIGQLGRCEDARTGGARVPRRPSGWS